MNVITVVHLRSPLKTLLQAPLSLLKRSFSAATKTSESNSNSNDISKEEAKEASPYFFHKLDENSQNFNAALSLISKETLDTRNRNIGNVNSKYIIGWVKGPTLKLDPKTFVENPAFNLFLHREFLPKYVFLDEYYINTAASLGSGWMHIVDWRAPAPLGRIPDPENIFGSVNINKGMLVIESYQPTQTHRLVSMNGKFQLGSFLEEKLLEEAKNFL